MELQVDDKPSRHFTARGGRKKEAEDFARHYQDPPIAP